MFFVLSKILRFLVYPLPLLFLILIGIVFFYHRKWARTVLLAAIVCFYGLSMPYTADRLMQWLESPPVSEHALRPHYDAVIVLSGMMDLQLSQKDHLEFRAGVDRILAGITLVRKGIGDVLLISGGTGNLLDQRHKEAILLKDFAIQYGLRAAQILVEPSSRNTYENAVNSAQLLRRHNHQRTLLVTSASHMRRAAAAFHKQGIYPDLYPVDFRAARAVTPFSFIPSEGGLHKTRNVIREWVGILMYRIQGYI